MALLVVPNIVAGVAFNALQYNAEQVRLVEPNTGIIHFVNGGAAVFGITNDASARTYVGSQNAGNVVPNPGDWILTARPPVPGPSAQSQGTGTSSATLPNAQGPGTQGFAQQTQQPVVLNPNGPFLYYTNPQFQAAFNFGYGNNVPTQGMVP